jgi:Leucine-rich repeat (LRR) protein
VARFRISLRAEDWKADHLDDRDLVSISICRAPLLEPDLTLLAPWTQSSVDLLRAALAAKTDGLTKGQVSDMFGWSGDTTEQYLHRLRPALVSWLRKHYAKASTALHSKLNTFEDTSDKGRDWRVQCEVEGKVVLTIARIGRGPDRRLFVVSGALPPRAARQAGTAGGQRQNGQSPAPTGAAGPDPLVAEAQRLSQEHYEEQFGARPETYVAMPAPGAGEDGPTRAENVAQSLKRADVRAVAVTGVGGVGKSALGRHLARTLGKEFPYRFVVRAEFTTGLKPSLASLALRLGLVEPPGATPEAPGRGQEEDWQRKALRAFRDWRPPVPCLLVLDNLGDPTDGVQSVGVGVAHWDDVCSFLPKHESFRVLVTSQARPTARDPDWQVVEQGLDPLPEDQGVALLLALSGFDRAACDPEIESAARRIVRLLSEVELRGEGDLAQVNPLALAGIGADVALCPFRSREERLAEWGPLVEKSLRAYQEAPRDALGRTGLFASLDALYELLAETPGAVPVLEAMAWVTAEEVPKRVLFEACGFRGVGEWDRTIAPLLARGLVVEHPGGLDREPEPRGSVSWHRSRQAHSRHRQGGSPDLGLLQRLTRAVVMGTPSPGLDDASERRRASMAAHTAELAEHAGHADDATRATLEFWGLMSTQSPWGKAGKRAYSAFLDWVRVRGEHQIPWLRLSGIHASDVSPIADLTDLRKLNLEDTLVKDVFHLSRLIALQELNLRNTLVENISPLAGLTALRRLDLWGTQVSDVSHLKDLTALKRLNLRGIPVSDVSDLAKLTFLERLDLWGTRVENISPLAGLTSLQRLWLSGTAVSDVSPLAGLTALQTLALEGTRVSNVSHLKDLTALKRLNLRGMPVSDVSDLAKLTFLEWLDLRGTRVENISPLARLTALEKLDLTGTPVSDVSHLAGLTALQYLNLRNTLVENISPLAGLTALVWLDLRDTQVSDFSHLARLTALRRLDLSGTRVWDVSLLAGLTALVWLDLSDTQVSDVSPLAGMPNLIHVQLPDRSWWNPQKGPPPERYRGG